MKTRYKILTSLLTPIAVTPAFFTSTGCSNNRYSKLAQKFYESIMEEFTEICKIYRRTFKTEEIARHINDRIYEMGLACYDDFARVKKHNPDLPSDKRHTSGNLLTKIEASSGCDEWPTVILQAHMDMVCDGFDETTRVITPVIDGDVLHSKDWKTSLGADNGIGLATLLTIIKYRDEFKHGPIRCIFTADEEDGEGCAHWIDEEKWIKGADYIINLDHESIDDVGVSCAGVQQCKLKIKLPKVSNDEEGYTTFKNHYQIKVWGANGGSSGFALENNPIFPIQLAFNMVQVMMDAARTITSDAEYIITNISTDDEETNGSGSISQNIVIEYLTNIAEDESLTLEAAKVAAKDYVIKMRAQHPSEVSFKTLIQHIPTTSTTPSEGIEPNSSELIAKFFIQDGLFGEIKKAGQTTLTTCSNAGPISIEEINDGYKMLTFETFGRSSLENVLGEDPGTIESPIEISKLEGFMRYYADMVVNVFGTQPDDVKWIDNIGWNPCWEENGSKFTNLYKSYAARNGKAIGDFRAMGWAETAEFVRKAQTLGQPIQASCIGPTIVDGHTKNGYCLVSSIKEFAERLIYGLENLSEI